MYRLYTHERFPLHCPGCTTGDITIATLFNTKVLRVHLEYTAFVWPEGLVSCCVICFQ